MRKILTAIALVAVLSIPVAAVAADLTEGNFEGLIDFGTKCKEDGYDGAYYYFVNNQTEAFQNPATGNVGIAGGELWADFGGAAQNPADPVTALIVNRYNQHFQVWSDGELQDAYTNLAGRLVLSHVTCKGGPSSEDFGL